MISEDIRTLNNLVSKMQAKVNAKGWSMDFESVLIALECHIETAERYEEMEKTEEVSSL